MIKKTFLSITNIALHDNHILFCSLGEPIDIHYPLSHAYINIRDERGKQTFTTTGLNLDCTY